MLASIWSKLRQGITLGPVGTLPGIIALGVIILLRLSSSLQFLEWVTLDSFLRLRPPEPIERVVIVGI